MSFPKVQDHILQPYKTTGIFVINILILTVVKGTALITKFINEIIIKFIGNFSTKS
jgi:hypothetical protein